MAQKFLTKVLIVVYMWIHYLFVLLLLNLHIIYTFQKNNLIFNYNFLINFINIFINPY